MKDLDVVYCKDCSSCNYRIIDKNSVMYSCRKNKSIQLYPNLFCNRPCFTMKKSHKKVGNKNGKNS